MAHRRQAKPWKPVLRMAQPEERGITLRQLKQLWRHMSRRCEHEGWMDVQGEPLEPSRVSIYELMRYVIKPLTADHA